MVAEGILAGRFRPGEKLPSSRRLAEHLGVSRITVTLAYTELVADDYLTARGRSGYFVSDNAPQRPAFDRAAGGAAGQRRLGALSRRRYSRAADLVGQARGLAQLSPIRSSTGRPTARCSTIRTGGFARCGRWASAISRR